MKRTDKRRMEKLWEIADSFIREQNIHCPETIHQCDRVILNACEFIEQVCEVVGYLGDDE